MQTGMRKIRRQTAFWMIFFWMVVFLTGCTAEYTEITTNGNRSEASAEFQYEALPEYAGNPYVEVNGNVPYFTEDEVGSESFETYGKLDALGRCTTSLACLSEETMPPEGETRGKIGNIKPSGWVSVKYDCVEGKYVMNRCHCIGWQLSAENDNPRNLISGSRYLNIEMLAYENRVADYIRETGNHVMYRVTPVFVGEELLCRGLLMEGYSVEDEGEGIRYCVFFYNVQPGIEFDYATGSSRYTGVFLDTESTAVAYEPGTADGTENPAESSASPVAKDGETITYILNRKTYKFHLDSCKSVLKMKESNKEVFTGNREYLLSIGYEPCGNCHP